MSFVSGSKRTMADALGSPSRSRDNKASKDKECKEKEENGEISRIPASSTNTNNTNNNNNNNSTTISNSNQTHSTTYSTFSSTREGGVANDVDAMNIPITASSSSSSLSAHSHTNGISIMSPKKVALIPKNLSTDSFSVYSSSSMKTGGRPSNVYMSKEKIFNDPVHQNIKIR